MNVEKRKSQTMTNDDITGRLRLCCRRVTEFETGRLVVRQPPPRHNRRRRRRRRRSAFVDQATKAFLKEGPYPNRNRTRISISVL